MTTEVPKRKRSLHIKDARIAGMYDLDKTIGQGHFAVVKLAKHVFTGEMVAVKIIDKANLDPVSQSHIMQEVRCMKLVQHPNIVRLYEVIDTQTKLFLILELGDYDMHDFILKYEKGCPEPLAQQYFSQIIKAINYCHKLHVVHRDLKPENVVFFEKLGMVKLTDFGFSNLYEPGEQLRTSCGSLAYSAPEILLGDAYDAPAVDVWSLGVILYMLVCGRLPFNEANDSETLTKILDCRFTLPDMLSQSCRNLIARILVRDPSKRATLSEIAVSPWVSSGDRGHAEAIPLIERHHLPDSAHTTIVEQMVAGGIGTEENILNALENDEYNYMSATYFLLAERVLASCREERARELAEREAEALLMADEELLESAEARSGAMTPQTAAAAARCRSRSNSWRATRRPCSILKEESEEELSTYLRSSRQSSRYFTPSTTMGSERGSATGSPRPYGSARSSRGGSPVSSALVLPLAPPESLPVPTGSRPTFAFDDLSPIAETSAFILGISKSEDGDTLLHPPVVTRRAKFVRTISEPDRPDVLSRVVTSSAAAGMVYHRLVRRNSSPSMSMFSVSARDRVSPQAVQDLLELTRLGSGARRAASPESVRSSRSPSPPGSSSGRASPAMSTLSLSRFKGPSIIGGGMRKLSSSPHLLGICEESEESDMPSVHGHTSLLNAPSEGLARTNRSASTGLVVVGRHPLVTSTKSTGQQPTYSSVRMIRPRQAVVSPDVCRRYEQHQRFVARSRRSTSCSSSEASDDEERNRLLLSSSRCTRLNERRRSDDGDDDPAAGGASTSGPSSSLPAATRNNVSSSQGGGVSNNEKSHESREGRSTAKEVCCGPSVSQLRPIPELTHLDSDDMALRTPSRMINRSATAERVVAAWTMNTSNGSGGSAEWAESWLATPPRDPAPPPPQQWVRSLHRTKSHETLSPRASTVEKDPELVMCSSSSVDMGMGGTIECSTSRDSLTDSGCSKGEREEKEREQGKKRDHRERETPTKKREPLRKMESAGCQKPLTLPKALRRRTDSCEEKVDAWLRSAQFAVVMTSQ